MSNVKLQFFEPPAVPGFGGLRRRHLHASCSTRMTIHRRLPAAGGGDREVHGGLALPHIIVDRLAHRRHDRHDPRLRSLAGDPQRRADRQHVAPSATSPRRRAGPRRRAAAGSPGRARRSTARSPPRRHFRPAPWRLRARPGAARSAAAWARACAAAAPTLPCCSAAYFRNARTPDSSRAAEDGAQAVGAAVGEKRAQVGGDDARQRAQVDRSRRDSGRGSRSSRCAVAA